MTARHDGRWTRHCPEGNRRNNHLLQATTHLGHEKQAGSRLLAHPSEPLAYFGELAAETGCDAEFDKLLKKHRVIDAAIRRALLDRRVSPAGRTVEVAV